MLSSFRRQISLCRNILVESFDYSQRSKNRGNSHLVFNWSRREVQITKDMYDFCVDVTGEDGNNTENVEFETFKEVTHQPSQECEENSSMLGTLIKIVGRHLLHLSFNNFLFLDLFKTLPELKDNSEL